jgi:hypothetical protein
MPWTLIATDTRVFHGSGNISTGNIFSCGKSWFLDSWTLGKLFGKCLFTLWPDEGVVYKPA